MSQQTFWNWKPGSNACPQCIDMAGTYHTQPERPHENCDCEIDDFVVDARLLYSTTDRSYQSSTLTRIGTVVKGSTATIEDTWSVGASGQVSTSASAEGGGFKAEGSATVGVEGSIGHGDSVTLPYQENVGGQCQAIFAVHDIYRVVEEKHWEGPNFTWVTTSSHTEREFREYIYLDTAALEPGAATDESGDSGLDDDDENQDGGGDDGGGDDLGGDDF